MDSANSTLKSVSRIALFALAILVAGAVAFYKERIFFADAAYVSFSIINGAALAIQIGRYGSFITQIVPYLGQYLHLPLATIFIGYSASFYMFYLAVVSVLVFWFKQYKLALIAALYYFLIFSDSYMWVSEIPQGIGWMFLLFGVSIYQGQKKMPLLPVVVPFVTFAFLSLTTHFVIIIPMVFLWVYFIIDKDNWPFNGKVTVLFSSLIVLVVAAKFFVALSGPQGAGGDGPHLYGVTHVSFKDIYKSFSTPVVTMFFYRCLVNYWVATLLFFAGVVSLLRSRKILLALWTVVSCLGYIVIMGLTYGDLPANVLLFHIESEWTSIGVIAAAGFVFELLPKLKPLPAVSIVVASLAIRLFYIGAAVPPFSARLVIYEGILTKMRQKNITKLALIRSDSIARICLLDWAAPHESNLISAKDGDKTQRTFFFVNADDSVTQKKVAGSNNFFDSYGLLPPKYFNKRYLNFDSTRPYQVMTYEDVMK